MSPTHASPRQGFSDDDARWRAVLDRDASADGRFVYSVRTTGVYCRPNCASRRALRANVRFHATCRDAEAAGFRPCRRCRPNEGSLAERHAAIVAGACRLIEESDEAPSLETLAESAGLSVFHFHRVFKAQTGVTPKAYAAAHRAGRVRDELAGAGSVTQAIQAAGYASNSRFYEASPDLLGMTPTAFRSGGAGEMLRFAIGESWLGPILVASSDAGICAILLGDDPDALARDLQDRFPNARLVAGDPDFDRLVALVVGLAESPSTGPALPLDIRGTAFRLRVWEALRSIPVGTTATYAQVASQIGQPTASRAVAQACASNPIAIAIPCHRVVRTDGSLSGYRWGVERKDRLLKRERGE